MVDTPEGASHEETFDPQVVFEDSHPGPAQPSEADQSEFSDDFAEPHRPGERPEAGTQQSEPEQPEAADSAEEEPLVEFDQRYRQPFEGLLFLGKLTKSFRWLGHEFTIRTLTVGELMEVGLLHRDYRGSLGETRAWQSAVVAACVERVDGQTLPVPPDMGGPDEPSALLKDRFDYVSKRWYPPTVDHVYEQYLILEAEVERTVDALGNRSGQKDATRT